MLRGRSRLVQAFLKHAPQHKISVGPLSSVTTESMWGVRTMLALPNGATVFFEPPRLLVTNRGCHSSHVWSLTEEALAAGFVVGTTTPPVTDRPPLLTWTQLLGTPVTERPLSGVDEASERHSARLPPNLCEPWLEWDSTDYMEAVALATKYGTSWNTVVEAYVDLCRTSKKSDSDAIGFYPILAIMNHACVANVEVLDVHDHDFIYMKEVKTLRAVAAGEELRCCYASARWAQPAEAAMRRDYLKNKFGFRCSCFSCETGISLGFVGQQLPVPMTVPSCLQWQYCIEEH